MSKVLVIPDVHLKTKIFDRAEKILDSGQADFAVQLGDLVDDWDMQFAVAFYQQTMERVLAFHKKFPKTLWCMGNHDYYAKSTWVKELFASVDYYKEIYDKGRKVVLCHYPIARWNGIEKGSYHLYGHVHSRPGEWLEWHNAFNVGVDVNDYKPKTLDQLIKERSKNDKV